MTDGKLTQHMIEQEAMRAAAEGGMSHLEAMTARISAEVTAEAQRRRFQPGSLVILKSVADALLHGLDQHDQQAIVAAVGHPVTFVGFDAREHAEVEFRCIAGHIHTIWVEASRLEPV